MKSAFKKSILFAGFLVGLMACSDNEKTARVEIRLTDAPGDYQAVNLDIDSVSISASSSDKGWISIPVHGETFDLLKLTNGLDTLLGTFEIPSGQISQIRLKLGDNNSLQVDGQTYDLDVPSGQQSGLKIQVHQELQEGVTYKFLLDFDVAKSIVQTGAGQYKLKPVVRAVTEAQNGSIKGTIAPVEASPAVYAIAGNDTIASAFCDTTSGAFLLRAIPAGSYTVSFAPASGFVPTQQNNVSVQTGVANDLGTIEIAHD